MLRIFRPLLFSLASPLFFHSAFAVMQPQTSVIFIDEEKGGGSINVTNTDDREALLYVKVNDLDDDKQPQVVVTQPVVRVGAGQTQRVRFVLSSQQPLNVEHIKRVTFEGLPLVSESGKNKVSINVRQDLPLIIRPRALAAVADPWKALAWSVGGGKMTVHNATAFVIRLGQDIVLLPSRQKAKITKSYLLPGETLAVAVSDARALVKVSKVRFDTLSQYGYDTGAVEMSVSHGS